MNKVKNRSINLLLLIALFLAMGCTPNQPTRSEQPIQNKGVQKMEYNNPGLLVDLDVGFKSVPMPMDFDGDGDLDLLISESGSYAESGVFYFENISGNVDLPVYRYGMRVNSERFRLGYDGKFFEASDVNGHIHVLTPDRTNETLLIYEDVPQNVFWKRMNMPAQLNEYVRNTNANTWKIIDFDGDSKYDLVAGIMSRQGNSLLFFKNSGTNEKPVYEKPENILTGKGKPFKNGLNLEVALADYDNDGDVDYVVTGRFTHLVYFENKGTPQKHLFSEGDTIRYNGEKIQLVSRSGSNTKLKAIDFNRDGFVDIIAGDEDGKVSFLKNTGKIINGVTEFLPPVFLQQEAKFLDLGALAAPRVFDWDGDGLDDILGGNGVGNVYFVKNLGGDISKWAAPKILEVDGTPIRIIPTEVLPNTEDPHWGYTTVDVGDWDMDGLPDILVNEHNGNIVWLRNKGTRTKPELSKPQPIEVEWKGEPLKPAWTPGVSKGKELLAPWRTSPFIMDFNNDGLNDLVMLDYKGYLAVYLRFKKDGKLLLAHPQRNFIYPDGEPILLNQRTGSSHGRLKITFADWDGDGLEDLVFSSKPAVDWMKNMGMEDGKMVLQYMGRIVSRTLMGHTDGPVVSDLNNDGSPDLLVGTETGVLY
ncbi:FG-GAP repeat domain-containing protein, partial [Mariniphaga sediminis]|uniref:FG-GAP repeat domain-containing protein n=1 Tax=Mariniphaga sediminis TaxID=1628158 RepID=UPI00356A3BD5